MPTSESLPRRPRVLFVDDDYDALEIMRIYSGHVGIDFRGLSDSREAVATAAAWQPDAVVFDLMMPCINGFDLIPLMRDNPATAEIPVLILTATRPGKQFCAQCQGRGACDCLLKPMSPQAVMARVLSCIGEARALRQHQEFQEAARDVL